MKRMVALLLTICLLLPFAPAVVHAEATSYKELADIPLDFNQVCTVNGAGYLFGTAASFEPIDLTQFGYPANGTLPANTLGLQMDIAVSGVADVVEGMENHHGIGQFEITSSGTCDTEELSNSLINLLSWQANAWTRCVVDLSRFIHATGGAFDPTTFNYIRIYMDSLTSYAGQSCYVKIANVKLVDLTETVAVENAPALGDGTAGDQKVPTYVYDAPGYKELAMVEYTKASFPGSVGDMFYAATAFDPIDLTAFGYPTDRKIEAGKLGLQIDLYMDVSSTLENSLASGLANGQIEITSGGVCDVEEMGASPALLKWKNEGWYRMVLDLARFSPTIGTFDPTNFNFFRVYMNAPNNNSTYFFKMCNIRVVDLTAPLSETEAPMLGDGVNKPNDPIYTVENGAWDYNPETAVVSGYNLMRYAQTHNLLPVSDWSPLIQMLLFSLAENGGGTLYLPTGTYDCYSPISIPKGCVLQGDWVNPDASLTVQGTILAVHTGADTTSPAFIAMSGQGVVRNLSFWYPEQSVNDLTVYPPTIEMNQVDRVENITLVNAYRGIVSPYPVSCPNTESIYGTPLYSGIEMLSCSDQWEMEDVHFSPQYWMRSGLAGAPTSAADKKTLQDILYYDATGITLGRIDWSWVSYSSVRGYSIGLKLTPYNEQYTNGMAHEILLEDCYTAIHIDALLPSGFLITSTTIKNCRFGVFVADGSNLHSASLKMMDMDISATDAALVVQEMMQVSLTSSIIRKGAVRAESGWLTVADTVFYTAAPHLQFDRGTQAATVTACKDERERAVQIENEARCPLTVSDEAIGMKEIPTISTDKGGISQNPAPISRAVTIAALDNSGRTDVSGTLNALLTAQAAVGGTVFLPPGQYRLDNPITVPSGVMLLGALDIGQDISDYTLGSVFVIYHGRGTAEGATILLEENAGLRGIKAQYPEQTFKNEEIVPYPYTIQGQGANIHVINVSVLNAYGLADFMTYRCDNHYIDAVRGAAFDNFLKIGGGAVGGIVRNCHQQFSSFASGDRKTAVMNYACGNEEFFIVGDVTDEVLVGNFAYACETGMRFVSEDSGAADVTVYAFVFDNGTTNLEVEDAERIDVIALQTTCFTFITDEGAEEMNHVYLHDTFDGTVNVWAGILYENPDYVFRVEGGTFNLYSFIMRSSSTLTKALGNGKIRLIDGAYTNYQGALSTTLPSTLALNGGKGENVEMWLGYYFTAPNDTEELARYEAIRRATTSWYFDPPNNLTVPQGAVLTYSDAFTDYSSMLSTQKMESQISGNGKIDAHRGILTIENGDNSMITAVSSNGRMELGGGNNHLLEMRLKVNSLRQGDDSTIGLSLYSEKGSQLELVRITEDGSFCVRTDNGWQTYGNVTLGGWYRLRVELQMKNEGNYTYTVTLCDDNYQTVLSGKAISLNLAAVCGVWFGVTASPAAMDGTTEIELDYVAVMSGERFTAMLGDVDSNGKVDSTDARLTLQYAVKKITDTALDLSAADVDGNGKVDSTDARLMLQYAVKKIQSFPAA